MAALAWVRIITELFQVHQNATAAAPAARLMLALAFSSVMYGPDAHAKNYSILLAGDQAVSAPLYAISSVLPYPDRFDLWTMMITMSVNKKYQYRLITGADRFALARAANVDEVAVLGWVREVVAGARAAFADPLSRQEPSVPSLPVARDLAEALT